MFLLMQEESLSTWRHPSWMPYDRVESWGERLLYAYTNEVFDDNKQKQQGFALSSLLHRFYLCLFIRFFVVFSFDSLPNSPTTTLSY